MKLHTGIKLPVLKGTLIIMGFFYLCIGMAYGQACCASGTPVTNNMLNYSLVNKGFSAYMLHDRIYLNELISGFENLEDDRRERITHTLIPGFTYNIDGNWGLTSFIPYVWKTEFNQSAGQVSKSSAKGLGDISLLGFYQTSIGLFDYLYVGSGVKFPTGKIDNTDMTAITHAPDLQSGTGAFDFLFLINYSKSLDPIYNLNMSASTLLTTYSHHFTTFENYKFGDEVRFQAGISRIYYLVEQLNLQPFVFMKYRFSGPHMSQGFEIPNTGGQWLFLTPRMDFVIFNKIGLHLRLDIPLVTYLEGTQLSTTYEYRLGLEYIL